MRRRSDLDNQALNLTNTKAGLQNNMNQTYANMLSNIYGSNVRSALGKFEQSSQKNIFDAITNKLAGGMTNSFMNEYLGPTSSEDYFKNMFEQYKNQNQNQNQNKNQGI